MKTTLLTLVFIAIVLAIVILLITSIVYIYYNKQQINSQWPEYKCKPYVFPFAGIFIGPSTTNPMDNFRDCSWLIFKSFFNVLIMPFIDILEMIVNILTNYQEDIQNVRKMFNYIRNSYSAIATDIYNKLYDAYYRIAYMYRSFMKVFYQIFQTYVSAINTMLYGFFTLGSIWNGPIGGVTRFFCFDTNTNIEMMDGTFRLISQLDIGQYTKYGGKILGIYKTTIPFDNMYVVNNRVIVSGTHKLLDDGEWKQVSEYKDAVLLHDYPRKIKQLYCLATEYNIITTDIKDLIFADWNQCNYLQKEIYYASLYYLNNNSDVNKQIPLLQSQMNEFNDIKHFVEYYNILFDGENLVLMDDDTKKKIKDIQIGDKVKHGNKVIAVITELCNPTYVYKYKDVITTSCAIYYDNKHNRWRNIMENRNKLLYRTTKVNIHSNQIMYSLLTENEMFMINGVLWRDYEVNANMSLIVENYIDGIMNNQINYEISL